MNWRNECNYITTKSAFNNDYTNYEKESSNLIRSENIVRQLYNEFPNGFKNRLGSYKGDCAKLILKLNNIVFLSTINVDHCHFNCERKLNKSLVSLATLSPVQAEIVRRSDCLHVENKWPNPYMWWCYSYIKSLFRNKQTAYAKNLRFIFILQEDNKFIYY